MSWIWPCTALWITCWSLDYFMVESGIRLYVTEMWLLKGKWLGRKVGGCSAQYLSWKVLRDWSIIKVQERSRRICMCCFFFWNSILLSLLVCLRKKDIAFLVFINEIFLSCRVPTFRGKNVVKHGGHQGISFLFIDWTRTNLQLYFIVL